MGLHLTGRFAADELAVPEAAQEEVERAYPVLEQLDEQTRKVEALCTAAQLVLESGGETYRVEETVLRMAKGLGMDDVNVVAFPTSIFVETQGRACVRRISRRGTNMRRLVLANDVSRRAARGEMTLGELERALYAISRDPGRRQWVLVLACALACGSFSLSYGGGLGTFFVALAIGALMQAMQPPLSRTALGPLFANFAGGLMTAVIAQSAARIAPYGDVNATIIGGIMPLLSGLLMTTAVRDTMSGDLVSGVARAVEALLLAASAALGVYAGLSLMVMLGGMPL